jgi:hypothetical protein
MDPVESLKERPEESVSQTQTSRRTREKGLQEGTIAAYKMRNAPPKVVKERDHTRGVVFQPQREISTDAGERGGQSKRDLSERRELCVSVILLREMVRKAEHFQDSFGVSGDQDRASRGRGLEKGEVDQLLQDSLGSILVMKPGTPDTKHQLSGHKDTDREVSKRREQSRGERTEAAVQMAVEQEGEGGLVERLSSQESLGWRVWVELSAIGAK